MVMVLNGKSENKVRIICDYLSISSFMNAFVSYQSIFLMFLTQNRLIDVVKRMKLIEFCSSP